MQKKSFSATFLIFILAFMSALAPLSTDMYLPALQNVAKSFATNEFYTGLSISLFFIGFAIGQLIYGPLSDIFGRKIPLIFGVIFFILSSLGCVVVDNVHHFILLRFFEALGGCSGVVIARAIVNDKFEFEKAGAIYSILMVVGALAPMIAPSLGGIILKYFSWQNIFVTLFGLGILLILLIIFGLDETNFARKSFSFNEILHGYKAVLGDKIFVGFALTMAFSFSSMFAYITVANPIFVGHFGIQEQIFGLIFGLNSLGLMIASIVNAKLERKFAPISLLKFGLVMMIICAGFAWFLGKTSGLVGFEIALFFTIATNGFIIPTTTLLAMKRHAKFSGTASAILGFLQFSVAGFVSFMVSKFAVWTPWALGASMMICAVIGTTLFLVLIFKKV